MARTKKNTQTWRWGLAGALALTGACAGEPSFEEVELAYPGEVGEVRTGVFASEAGPLQLTYALIQGEMVYQGDIILSPDDLLPVDRLISSLTVASATRDRGTRRWPRGVVPFTIQADLPSQQRVTDAIAHWEANTRIRFVARTSEANFVTFRPGSGCSSPVGRQGGQQFVNLAGTCSTGNTIHEIGHAVGLWHEQSRTDRDDHIEIHWSEITLGDEPNFETYAAQGVDGRNVGPYDLSSMMHYSSFAFSKGLSPTITRLDGTTFAANRTALTQTDICGVHSFYGFGADSDINGDGFADLVAGIPFEDLTGSDEGAVALILGGAAGLTTTDYLVHRDVASVEGTAASGDAFGYSIATGDFDGDCLDDIAVGVPDDDVDGLSNAGSVHIFYGTALGFPGTDEIWHPNVAGILGASEANAHWGRVLEVGDFNGDGMDDLAVGVPYEDIGSITDTGVVNVIYGSASGLTAAGNQLWNQNSAGIQDVSAVGEHFGYALAAGDFNRDGFDELVVGVPDQAIGGASSAGAIHIIRGSINGLTSTGNQFFHEDNSGLPTSAKADDEFGSALAAGDFDGDGIDDLAVGVPGETVSLHLRAGSVTVLYGTDTGINTSGSEAWKQSSSGILDGPERDDRFGRVLVAADFDGDGFEDLAVGVPNEELGGEDNAGAVNVIYGGSGGLSSAGNQFWNQDAGTIVGLAEANDYFGYSMTAADYNGDGFMDLCVGVPYEDVDARTNAGAVNVIFGAATGLTSTGNQILHQDSAGILDVAETSDRFGYGL